MTRRAAAAAGSVAGAVADLLGGTVRSVILHGSLTAGGFRPGHSDLDLLVVVDGPLTDAQAAALERLAGEADLGAAAGLDLHVVTAQAAATPSPAPPLELYIGGHGRLEVERRVAAAPDLPAELSMARAYGRALVGAPPHEVIAPVPPEWIVDRGRHWLTTWLSLTDDTEHAAFMVLTACRIWRFAIERVHSSKERAAAWALTRDPTLTVVQRAVRRHLGDPTAVVDERGIANLLATVLRETAPGG